MRLISRARQALAVLGVVTVTTIGLTALSQTPATAVGSYNNGDIATTALAYIGQWGGEACRAAGKLDGDNTGSTVGGYGAGQCRTFVNCVVYVASGHTQYPVSGGGDYFQGFLGAGGQEITSVENLTRGDIVQKYVSSSNLHTMIIVDRVGGNTFNVVDSNYGHMAGGQWVLDEMVQQHQYTLSLGTTMRAFRMGTVNGPSSSYINARLMGDVNGDGKADAVVMFGQTGAAKVALSTGSQFGYPGDWSYGHSVGASAYLMADVSGDGKADLLAYFASTRKWFASLSSGNGFWSPTEWAYDGSLVPDRTFFADANGDGKADKIFFINGTWWVGISSGSGFWTPTVWASGHGVGASDVQVGDFNGDGKADAAVWFASNGNWYVALSTGSQFGGVGQWSASHGQGTTFRLTGDTTGDGKADIAYYSNSIYKWWVGASSGSGFWGLAEWSYDGPGYNTMDNAFLADVDGDGKADKVLFFRNSGDWYVGTSAGSAFWGLNRWIPGHGAGS